MGKELKMRPNNNNFNFSEDDYEFMNSLSSAVLENGPKKLKMILWFWIFTILTLLVWAYFAQIDEIVRSNGRVVASSENQMIQNLEGGIIKEILVKEGDIVKKGQILIKIDNQKSESTYQSANIKSLELTARIIRLSSEANNMPFVITDTINKELIPYIQREQTLHEKNLIQIQTKIDILNEQLIQKENDLHEAKSSLKYLKNEYRLITEEVDIAEPLVKKGIRSRVDFLKLQREANNIKKELDSVNISIPKIESAKLEIKNKIDEVYNGFKTEAQEELNKSNAELARSNASKTAFKDQVQRTNVYSPTNGIIQKLFLNTIAGVIKPGENLVEIVPTDDNLLIEAKIKPADIAFIYYKQKAKVKFTAYDYSIYGGLDGEVIKISADTEIDEDKKSYYMVHIQTTRNHLKKGEQLLPIIPGMVVNVDILTGKKTILDYILKPILKAKEYTFTER